MALVQVDEAELLQYKQLHGAAQAILANPDARKHLHQAQKIVNPNARIPEVEIEERVAAEVGKAKSELQSLADELRKDREERAAAEQAAKLTNDWERQKTALRSQGFTDDGLAKIENHALEEGIPNLRAAANDYLALHPPAEPVQSSGFGAWDFFGPDGTKEEDSFVKDMVAAGRDGDEGRLNREIHSALSDYRSQQAPRGR